MVGNENANGPLGWKQNPLYSAEGGNRLSCGLNLNLPTLTPPSFFRVRSRCFADSSIRGDSRPFAGGNTCATESATIPQEPATSRTNLRLLARLAPTCAEKNLCRTLFRSRRREEADPHIGKSSQLKVNKAKYSLRTRTADLGLAPNVGKCNLLALIVAKCTFSKNRPRETLTVGRTACRAEASGRRQVLGEPSLNTGKRHNRPRPRSRRRPRFFSPPRFSFSLFAS